MATKMPLRRSPLLRINLRSRPPPPPPPLLPPPTPPSTPPPPPTPPPLSPPPPQPTSLRKSPTWIYLKTGVPDADTNAESTRRLRALSPLDELLIRSHDY
ncbi:hypothetical protein HZH66_012480 [Vespula vulgaris]|uniref:Uncharacterized protein n=1 Tax=Vespula vulgaris TaxID=7454 RepID=A0A834MTS6_VESVU|nr:hypothetical protein HZH66_012480 [Vespula vulgaris]